MHVNKCCDSWRQKCNQREAEKILKYKDPTTEIKLRECKSKRETSDRGDWNHFKITHTIPEQHTRKA
jgi:hypothetical protein